MESVKYEVMDRAEMENVIDELIDTRYGNIGQGSKKTNKVF